ncbi:MULTISPECIES: FAD-dependent oxidoreductase [Nocardioides]|uniref:3-phenylpropionate/trans-cinnamate dioxygenase ferredoxin reductase subunit n=2 Tax=Nocardioides TaxID=1839 RepID=A0A7Y9F358_9ACTN|nr:MULTISPECIES: FAD-dependent oxidoreductase [Nocardioides]MAS55346.1 pyridine nucleotide-disulfide oxidoreductase [Pimelobacter sp.]MBU2073770.1 FAD-dependent oxidoreductase [Actinomycetota bacterium]MBU2112091.1 FAD-dependent oxidoreductase [Actinomycetota bacterium]MDE0776825.1 FAD-dependent oxidoreductase [Nocardioides sp.]MDO3396477.1 FAD-dependent oxidoreductase [Nocardioides cremeus]
MTEGRALVVGASHAGVQVAAGLRQQGWSGEVVVVGDEPALPYHRPPLSKAYLAGTSSLQDLALRKAEFYAKHDIRLVQSTVTQVDRAAQQVGLNDGTTMGYTHLALCTGGRVRTLDVSGIDLPGVFYLRTFADVESIRALAASGSHAVIVGGGYVGLETAASLRALGLDVTVLEAAERVLERVTAPEVSAFYERVHRDAGVVIRTGAQVSAMAGDQRVREVVLRGGERIPADLVVVGVGLVPNTELAAEAGLYVENGIVIDDLARTSDPRIVAAGDCASHRMARYDRLVRLESVPSAGEQAKTAAATLCGKERPIAALPWFWSDQYDLKLQIAGLNLGYDELVLSGDPSRDRDFTCYYLQQGRLLAADCVNRPRDFLKAKQLISQGLGVDRAQLESAAAAS